MKSNSTEVNKVEIIQTTEIEKRQILLENEEREKNGTEKMKWENAKNNSTFRIQIWDTQNIYLC